MKKIARRQQQQQQQQEQEQMGGTRRGPSRGGRQSNDDSEGKTRTQLCEMAWWKVWTRLCLSTDGSSSHGLDGLLSYSSLQRQQLLALDPNIYGSEQFRHGLTPPQLGPEQMHSYGKDLPLHQLQHWLFFQLLFVFERRLYFRLRDSFPWLGQRWKPQSSRGLSLVDCRGWSSGRTDRKSHWSPLLNAKLLLYLMTLVPPT